MLVCGEELQRLIQGLPGSKIAVGDTSVTLHLDHQFLKYDVPPDKPIILPSTLPTRTVPLNDEGQIVLAPGESILACTEESISLPLDVFGWLQTKGNVARAFLNTVVSDSQIDPGFSGKITLELINQGSLTLALRPGIEIAQLYLFKLANSIEMGYNGRFQNAKGPTAMLGT